MQVTFLGTGGAGGVPRYGCECVACERARRDRQWRREPCSALIETADTRILLDAGLVDLHERFPPGSLDAIVLTHFHVDHVQGLFHLRWGVGKTIPVWGPPDRKGCADLYKHPGILEFASLRKFHSMRIGSLTLTPLPLIHSKVTLGFALESDTGGRFAYLTDTVGLPPKTLDFLTRWQPHGLALDCSHAPQPQPPPGHNDLNLALSLVEAIAPQQAWLTHISHNVDRWQMETGTALPDGVAWACDQQKVLIPDNDL